VRAVAAIPAIGLLIGAAAALLVSDLPGLHAYQLLIPPAAAAFLAWRARAPRVLAVAVGIGFCFGGALLAADAWHERWRPSLRVEFEELARKERAQAAVERRAMPEDDEAFALVTGVLRGDAMPTDAGVGISLDVETIESGGALHPVRGGVAATVIGALVLDRIDAWRAGRRVRTPIQLRRPSRYLDPGVPDFERAAARRGTTLVGTVKSGALVEVLAHGSAVDEAMAATRMFARGAIARAVGYWSARSQAIVAAIVIGDRVGLDQDVQRQLQEAGTYHVIAISGGNIAILAGLMLGAFRLAGLFGRTAAIAAITTLIGYADFVGGGASVDRATLMAVVYFGGRAIDQRSPPLNTLAFVAALLVAADPVSVVDPAFILTFGATLAILVVMPLVPRAISNSAESTRVRFAGLISAGLAMFAASAAAEAVLFPVGALVFSRVTFAGLGLNFLAIPLMGVAQIAGMAVVPLALVSDRLALVAGWVGHVGAAGLVQSASLVHLAPQLAYRVAPPGWQWVALYYIGLITWFVLWTRKRERAGSAERRLARALRLGAAVTAVIASFWILGEPWAIPAARGDGRLHVTFIDVGQGDAAFVRLPAGATMLVDAGGLTSSSSFDVGDRVVAPVMRQAGVRRLDYLVLTHGDPDHVGGASAVLREFHPREVWEGIPVPPFEPLQALHQEARELGVTWTTVKAGDSFFVDGVEVVVRHPPSPDWERQKVRNDDSIVVDLRWRDASFLLTGDIGKAVERLIERDIPPSPLLLVKVPHHGSLTSSTVDFIRAVSPRIAVVSVGRANHFGHPAPEVLQRYADAGAEIFRTDRDGAVIVDTDGESVEVQTFTGRHTSIVCSACASRRHEDQERRHEEQTRY
jgi:competence protein ComEC